MSRPKKPEGTKLAITPIRMPPPTKVKLEALSHQTGLTQQELIRRALDTYFDTLAREGKFDPSSRRPVGAKRMGRPPTQRPAMQPTPTPARRVFRRPTSAGASA